MDIQEIFELLANGVDPTTGEVFDTSCYGQRDVYQAYKKLKDVVSAEHKKVSKKGSYKKLCEEYPEHLILIKAGYFYNAYNESAEILGQVLGYKVAALSGHTPVTGGPDLSIIADGLRAANLSYIAFNNDMIEDRYDGKNPFV